MKQSSLYEYVISNPESPLYEAALKSNTDSIKLLRLKPNMKRSDPFIRQKTTDLTENEN